MENVMGWRMSSRGSSHPLFFFSACVTAEYILSWAHQSTISLTETDQKAGFTAFHPLMTSGLSTDNTSTSFDRVNRFRTGQTGEGASPHFSPCFHFNPISSLGFSDYLFSHFKSISRQANRWTWMSSDFHSHLRYQAGQTACVYFYHWSAG